MDVELWDFANWRDWGKALLNRMHDKGKRGVSVNGIWVFSTARVSFCWEVRLTILAIL